VSERAFIQHLTRITPASIRKIFAVSQFSRDIDDFRQKAGRKLRYSHSPVSLLKAS
jgi:hypothetical protein